MAFAQVDENNRVIIWSYEKLNPDWVEFDNGGFIDENCRNGLGDFVIRDGRAFYKPTAAKQVQELKAKLESTDYITAKALESIIGATDIVSLFAAFRKVGEEYAEKLAERERWREAIRSLED